MAIDTNGTRSYSVREQPLVASAPADVAAFARLYDRYLPRVYAYVARRVDDRAAAENVTATTFERAVRAIVAGDVGQETLDRFMYRVAATAVVDHARRGRRPIPHGVRASDLDGADERGLAESIADEAATRAFAVAIDRDRLRRALLRLPDADRRVIVLKYFDGLDLDEACAALACSPRTFAVKLHEALLGLQAVLDDWATDET